MINVPGLFRFGSFFFLVLLIYTFMHHFFHTIWIKQCVCVCVCVCVCR